MHRCLSIVALAAILCLPAAAVQRRHGILAGEVVKLDAGARTIVVKLADGTEHTLHVVKRTAVHGVQGTAAGAGVAFQGLKEGSQVAVHYTAKGSDETAEEIDNIGKDGLKSAEATVTGIDRGARKLTIRTADGAEETCRLTDSAARSAGTDIARGSRNSAKVTVFYTQEAGHKVVHFFKRAI